MMGGFNALFFISHLKTGFHRVLYIQMYMFYLHNNTVIKKSKCFPGRPFSLTMCKGSHLHISQCTMKQSKR